MTGQSTPRPTTQLRSLFRADQLKAVELGGTLGSKQFGPLAAFKSPPVVKRLPKTRSGKILRGTMKKIADGESWTMPATIDDPAVLDEIGRALKAKGVGA